MYSLLVIGILAVGAVFLSSYFISRYNSNTIMNDFLAPSPKGKVVELIGIKKKDSLNKWDGQMVAYRFDTGYVGMGVFEDGKDYVSSRTNPPSWTQVMSDIEKSRKEGWIDMTPEEIKSCAGMSLGKEYK